MQDCVFCKIASGTIPTNKVYEDDAVIAFHDMQPQAPVHVLIVPKAHARDVVEAQSFTDAQLAQLLRAAAKVAGIMGLEDSGFRLVINTGSDAGQTVHHLHVHLLGGKPLATDMA